MRLFSAQLLPMAMSGHLLSNVLIKGSVRQPLTLKSKKFAFSERFKYGTRRSSHPSDRVSWCCLGLTNSAIEHLPYRVTLLPSISGIEGNIKLHMQVAAEVDSDLSRELLVADLDPASAKLAISILGPFLSAFAFLFILRIVMSWYPKLPVDTFPYVVAYAPTEPFLIATRKVIPPLGGVDVTPVVWFGLVSFLNEILLGPQGLLVLISQQIIYRKNEHRLECTSEIYSADDRDRYDKSLRAVQLLEKKKTEMAKVPDKKI